MWPGLSDSNAEHWVKSWLGKHLWEVIKWWEMLETHTIPAEAHSVCKGTEG